MCFRFKDLNLLYLPFVSWLLGCWCENALWVVGAGKETDGGKTAEEEEASSVSQKDMIS